MAQSKAAKEQAHQVNLSVIPKNKRTFDTISYMLMWWSSIIVIQGFLLGQSMLPPVGTLNIGQAIIAVLIACFALAALFSINGTAGNKYGIPFAIHSRASFGIKGSRVATLLRGLPAIFWLGISTWIGASAIAMVTNMLLGFGNTFVYFFLMLILQGILAALGIESIKWFESAMAVIIVLIMIYMMYNICINFNDQLTANWTSEGTWGMPFVTSIVAMVGSVFTGAVNISDLSRYLKKSNKANWVGHFTGIPISFAFLIVLGILSGAATGEWDPVVAIVQIAPNQWSAVLLLIFIALAQVTTNLTMNLMPPALMLMDFSKKLNWKVSVGMITALGAVTCPWILLTKDGFFGLINAYSAFLGPVLSVMIADFFFIRKQTLDVKQLYEPDGGTLYKFTNGWNVAAIAAVAIGGIPGILFSSLSWLVAMPIAFVAYLIVYPMLYGKNQQVPVVVTEEE